jgi:hypothetical protein
VDTKFDLEKNCDNFWGVEAAKDDKGNDIMKAKKCKYEFSNGYIEVNPGERVCNGFVMIPGSYMINTPTLAVFIFMMLIWLFMGIGVISDIFMNAIEEITA